MAFLINKHKAKTDENLMLLLTNGEQAAFDILYSRYSKPLLNFFYKMLNYDKERAEDLLQDLFVKIIEKPQLFDQSKKFSTWIYSIAVNMIKNEYRSRHTSNQYREYMVKTTDEALNEKTDIDKNIFSKQLNTELENTDEETKAIFNMRYREEMTIKQIAEIINLPEGTVKSRLFYLTKKLASKLNDYKPE